MANKNYMYSEFNEGLKRELRTPSRFFKDAAVRTARNSMFMGVLFGMWSSKCRNWTCSNEGPDFKPVRKAMASV